MKTYTNYFVALLILILIFCYACSANNKQNSNQQVAGENLQKIQLKKDLTIPGNTQEVLMGNIVSLAVGPHGDIFAADKKRYTIHMFAPKGDYVASLGQKGKGPGEFMFLNSNIKIQADTLYVLQRVSRLIELFNIKTHHFIRTIKIPKIKVDGSKIGNVNNLFPLANGKILLLSAPSYFYGLKANQKFHGKSLKTSHHFITISKIKPSGKVLKKILLKLPEPKPNDQHIIYLKSGAMHVFAGLTFYPEFKMAVGPKGAFYAGKSDSLIIQKYDQKGALINKIQASHAHIRFTNKDRDSLAKARNLNTAQFKKIINKVVGAPTYWPAFQNFVVDDKGRIWVELLNPGKKYQQWWIFNKTGKLKWKTTLPADLKVYTVQHKDVYGIYTPQKGLSSIERYHISGM
jgi:hypothetical protein